MEDINADILFGIECDKANQVERELQFNDGVFTRHRYYPLENRTSKKRLHHPSS
jgi:hypothetical protein